MNVVDLDPRLRDAIAAVSPDLLRMNPDFKMGITRAHFEEIFFRLVLNTDVSESTRLTHQLNAFLVSRKAVHPDENPGLSVTRLKRPAARINPGVMQDLKTLLRLEDVFLNSLTLKTGASDVSLGRLLFSAIRYGTLVREERIRALSCIIGSPLNILEGHAWFELPARDNEPAGSEVGSDINQSVIWNPDPLSLLLLYHLQEERKVEKSVHPFMSSKLDWFGLIKKFFSTQGIKWSRDGLPKKRFLDAVAARWSLDIPAFLVDCARGVHHTQTLHPQVYIRLITGKTPPLCADMETVARPRYSIPRIRQVFSASQVGVRDSHVLRETGRHLRTGGKRGQIAHNIRELIESESSNCTPLVILLCRWVASRLGQANRWGNRYSSKSAYTRMRSIARRLQGWLGSEDILKISSSKLVEIYEEIIDSVDTQSLRISISKNLREFHEFLEDEYGRSSLGQDAPWNGMSKQQILVDAKIILPREYEVATAYYRAEIRYQNEQSIKGNEIAAKLAQARWLTMAFGYRGGFRRREVIGLRLRDVTTRGRTEVLVRSHDGRKLKTHSGNRRSPVDVFFSAEELDLLQAWKETRISGSAKQDDYLFSIPELDTPFINESLIFDHIQWILQTISGDPFTRFHHLRHSFGTWRLWRWMIASYSLPQSPYAGMEVPGISAIYAERKRILGLTEGDEPSEKVLYALALAIGHSGPSMTLAHYVHSDPWLLELETQRHTPKVGKAVLAELGGVTIRQIESLANGSEFTALLLKPRVLRKLKKIAEVPEVKGWVYPGQKRLGIYRQDTVRQRSLGMDIWEALQLHTYHEVPFEELAERYCIERSVLKQAMDRANQIWFMKYKGAGHQSYRHRWSRWQSDDLKSQVLPYPHQKRQLNMVRHVLERYEALSESRRRLIRWAVGYFIENGSLGRARLRFDRKEDLKRFLRISNALILYLISRDNPSQKLDRFNLTLHSSFELGSAEREGDWVRWGRGLNLKGYQCQDQVKPEMKPGKNYVALRLLSLRATSSPKNTKSRNRPTDWGFRVSLYILAYAYGWQV